MFSGWRVLQCHLPKPGVGADVSTNTPGFDKADWLHSGGPPLSTITWVGLMKKGKVPAGCSP